MSEDFQEFLGELAIEGEREGGTTSFTLSTEKAREKLQEFALQHPEHYFLLVLAGLQTLGARNFKLRVDADDFEIEADCHISRMALTGLWSHVAGGAASAESTGLRLIALAILTSVRFVTTTWSIRSCDSDGSYEFGQSIKDSSLLESCFGVVEVAVCGTTVAVKRKSLGQVASRFLTQLKSKVLKRESPERLMLNQRMFLGAVDSFEFNKQALDCQMSLQPALAIMRQNSPPDFLQAKYTFTEGEEETETLTSLVVVLGRPGRSVDNTQLGAPNQIFWIWHGLRMGYTELGLPYDFCRVVYIADGMQTDLGFTSVSDTWERQHASRDAREAARALLHGLALQYTAAQKCGELSHDSELQSILLEVIARRIDTKKNPSRLARFNRDLLDCPLFLGSADDGVTRCFTLRDLWERKGQGEKLACFTQREEWEDVPVWPGRPVVIFGTVEHKHTLRKLFDEAVFVSARALARRLKNLELIAQGGRSPVVPSSELIESAHWSGDFQWEGTKLNWLLDLSRAAVASEGRVQVTRKDCLYFEDSWEELPHGLLLYGELPWTPHYSGGLCREDRSSELVGRTLLSLLETGAARQGPVTEQDIRANSQIWLELTRPARRSLLNQEDVEGLPWLLVRQHRSLSRLSLRDFLEEVSKLDSPTFYITPKALQRESTPDTSFSLPPTLVLPESNNEEFASWFPDGLHSIRGCELLSARQAHDFSDDFLVLQMDESQSEELDSRLDRVRLGVPKRDVVVPSADKLSLETNLRGASMQVRTMNCFITPVTVSLDWSEGWPDSRGCHFADKSQTEDAKLLLPRIVAWAAAEVFQHSSLEVLAELNKEFLNTCWLEFWSGNYGGQTRLFPRADGQRASFSELAELSEIVYFCDLERGPELKPDTLWLPTGMLDSLEILGSEAEWRHVDSFKQEAPRETSPDQLPEKREKVAPRQIILEEVSPTVSSDPLRAPAPKLEPETAPHPLEEVGLAEPESRPQSSPELKSDADAPQQPVTAPLPEMEPSGPSGRPLLDPDLELLLEALTQLSPVPHIKEFRDFVSRVKRDRSQERVLQLTESELVLGGETFLSGHDKSKLLLYLSALYSVFNRHEPKVEDKDEREFHALILARCDSLFGRSLGP